MAPHCYVLLFCALLCVILGAVPPGSVSGLHERALSAAREGNYRKALPLFQQVVKLSPTPEYWNNLGVTHMRLHEWPEAVDSLYAGKNAAFGHHVDCDTNLEEAAGYLRAAGKTIADVKGTSKYADGSVEFPLDGEVPIMKREPKVRKLAKVLRHKTRPLPRIPISELYARQENAQYARGLKPFILTGITQQASWKKKSVNPTELWGFDYFSTHFGDARVDYYPHNMEKSNVRPILMDMRAGIEDLRQTDLSLNSEFPRGEESDGRYLQWNMNAPDWRRVRRLLGDFPPLFESDGAWLDACLPLDSLRSEFFLQTHWRMLLIGRKDAGMFNHKDTIHTSSYQIQIVGAKRWHLCSPAQDHVMYDAGDVDAFNPDYDRFPYFKNADCFDDVVHAGEAVYYPRDYWHQTINLETPSISISSSLVDLDNYPHVHDALEKELKGETRTLVRASEQLKAAMRTKCIPAWNISFGSHTEFTLPEPLPHRLDARMNRDNVGTQEVRVQHDGPG